LKVNSRLIEEKIYDNICFPLCCKGGDYEWQDHGHYFRAELPSLYLHDGLYVDGKELRSQRLNTEEWKCQFSIWLILGIIITFLGIIFLIIDSTDCCWVGFLYLGISCLITGIVTTIPGLIGWYRAINLNRKYKYLKKANQKSDVSTIF